jgi:5'-nucleotidase
LINVVDQFSEKEIVVYTDGDHNEPPLLRLIHYNDVYHVDPASAEPVGGVGRFQTLINYYRNDDAYHGQPELVVAFSGDAFNPSLESSVTKGVPLLLYLSMSF